MLSYTKKVERLERSIKQTNIKLISKGNYIYTVCGNTGSLYTITIDENIVCTCIDCKRNKNYCKHIYFIFLNIYGFTPDINRVYTVEELKTFHDIRVQARNETDDCPICFEIMSPEDCLACLTCKNGCHTDCIKTLLKFNNKCPLCQSIIRM